MKLRISLSLVAALAGCMDASLNEDGRDDAFAAEGKADGFAVTPQEATAILNVANTFSVSKLRTEVTVAKRTAENIVQARSSAPLTSLAALDAVPYVGPVALQKLLDYVHAENLVPTATPKQWSSENVGWGSSESLGFWSDGDPLVAYRSSPETVDVWHGGGSPGTYVQAPTSTPNLGRTQLAFDAQNAPHVFYAATDYQSFSWKQIVMSPQTGHWAEQDEHHGAYDLVVNQGPAGAMFALTGNVTDTDSEDIRFGSLGSDGLLYEDRIGTTSHGLDQADLVVDSSGVASVTYVEANRGVHLMRMEPNGWTDELVMQTISSGRVASSGGMNPLVFVAFPYDGVRIFRRASSGFAQIGMIPVNSMIDALDASTDGDGGVHLCYVSGKALYSVLADRGGSWTQTALGTGNACQMQAAVDGTVHIVTHDDDDHIRHLVYH